MPTHCTATRKDGRPCRAWAVPGSSPPTCVAHGGRRFKPPVADAPASPYRRDNPDSSLTSNPPPLFPNCSTEELAGPAEQNSATDLAEELAAARVAVRRITQLLESEPRRNDYAELVGQLFRGADTIARLLRTQRILSGEAADGLVGAVAQVLDELSSEWQVAL